MRNFTSFLYLPISPLRIWCVGRSPVERAWNGWCLHAFPSSSRLFSTSQWCDVEDCPGHEKWWQSPARLAGQNCNGCRSWVGVLGPWLIDWLIDWLMIHLKRGKCAASDNLATIVLAGHDAPSANFQYFFPFWIVPEAYWSPPFPSCPGLPSLDAAFQSGVCQGVSNFGLRQIEFWILDGQVWMGQAMSSLGVNDSELRQGSAATFGWIS